MAIRKFDHLPLEWIRAFEAAARTGSFTAAARETGLTQASISQRIGHLEQTINTPLFIRGARGVRLSVDGEAWLPYVTNALETLRQSATDLFGAQHRKITIAAGASVIQNWLAPRLASFPQAPGLQISFTTMVVQSDARRQDATVEIRYGDGNWPGLRAERLFAESIAPVAAPALLERRGPWHLLQKIALSGPRMGWQEWARETGNPATPIPILRFDSLILALAAAKAGSGVALASLPLCADDLAAGRLVALSGPPVPSPQSYWMTAQKSAHSQEQWDGLAGIFCQ